MAAYLTKKFAEGESAQNNNQIGQAIKIYDEIIKYPLKVPDEITDDSVKAKEQATYKLANIYKDKGLVEELIAL